MNVVSQNILLYYNHLFSDRRWPWITEIVESKTVDKGTTIYEIQNSQIHEDRK